MEDFCRNLIISKNYNIEKEKARKINRFIGYETVVMGILAFVVAFLSPVMANLWPVMLMPYAAVGVFYGAKVGRSKKG